MVFGDELLESVNRMLESIFEDLSGPVVPSGLLFIDDVDEDFEFAFVCVVF